MYFPIYRHQDSEAGIDLIVADMEGNRTAAEVYPPTQIQKKKVSFDF
jgi:hypothetical protein